VKHEKHPAPDSEFVIHGPRYWRAINLLLALATLLGACHSQQAPTGPTIQFTKIPPASQGGRERVDTITGRVTGAHPGQQIVIYARSGPWWVQPWPDKPFIPIQADSTWGTSTHLGFEYAAMLVESGYHPPATMDVAPTQGGSVVTVSIVKGIGEAQLAPVKPLRWSGYDWDVRTISADRGGMNNLYGADNAWTDASGALHMRITKKGDRWSCAELEMTHSLGYGTYIVTVRDTTQLEPAAVLSLRRPAKMMRSMASSPSMFPAMSRPLCCPRALLPIPCIGNPGAPASKRFEVLPCNPEHEWPRNMYSLRVCLLRVRKSFSCFFM